MLFHVNTPVSINLSRIIIYAKWDLIHPPLANQFLIRLKRFDAIFKRFHSGTPIRMVKILSHLQLVYLFSNFYILVF